MNRLLIIDSGGTKADWSLMEEGNLLARFKTPGLHPFFLSDDELRSRIIEASAQTGGDITHIFFYGAGCKAENSRLRLNHVFREVYASAGQIEIHTDVLGAARALCGRQSGIACILGTGSNSVWYDGQDVVQNSGGYGYILGDEGGGAVLGKELVGAWLYRELPAELMEAFDKTFELSTDEMVERVYRGDAPSRFLAGFVPFLAKYMEHDFVQQLLQRQFALFIRRCVLPYPDAQQLPVHFTGSVAFHFRSALEKVLPEAGLRAGLFLAAPMEGLQKFHTEA